MQGVREEGGEEGVENDTPLTPALATWMGRSSWNVDGREFVGYVVRMSHVTHE